MTSDQYSEKIGAYFTSIDTEIMHAYNLAQEARKQGLDPEDHVEIQLAQDMAERTEGLISVVCPEIIGSGVKERIRELEKKYGSLAWQISLLVAQEIAENKFVKFPDKLKAMDIGIRVGLAYHTMGVVASPLEGFLGIKLRKRKDNGQEYFSISFGGPIRSAGGTGASVAVLIADYVRKKSGYAAYDPTELEVKRHVREVQDFHERVTNLQYFPSEEELTYLVQHLPVQIDGDPSEKFEVSNFKDLDRIETNFLRNGICLVLAEALSQKAKKLWKNLSKWGHEFDLEQWDFLEEFLNVQTRVKAKAKADPSGKEKPKVSPDYTFINDLVAGRPIFTHPLKHGGFRLRFGRSRTSGFSSYNIHPATMFIVNEYLATATQLKLERPGKATSVTAGDSIEGPIVKLQDGSVHYVDTIDQAKRLRPLVTEIIYLGDMLVNYGDFFNRGHILVPPGYCEEWWTRELEKAITTRYTTLDIEKAAQESRLSGEYLGTLIADPFSTKITAQDALTLSKSFDIPLHPKYTYHWNALKKEEFLALLAWYNAANHIEENGQLVKTTLPLKQTPKRALELIGVPHIIATEFVVIDKEHALALRHGIGDKSKRTPELIAQLSTKPGVIVDLVNELTSYKTRDKSGLFIGARMGRPEKAKQRKLTGSPQTLFPVGDEGGRLRCFQSALEKGSVVAEYPNYYCEPCKQTTIWRVCERCNQRAEKRYFCRQCKVILKDKECKQHGPAQESSEQTINIKHHFETALRQLNMQVYPDLIKGVRGTSNESHVAEHITKGILRAKHDVYVNKDGTTRYDMSQIPITHFKPKEIGTTVQRLLELGYDLDIKGKPLVDSDQVLELKPQDIVLPKLDPPLEGAHEVLVNVTHFIDDLLELVYHKPRYYNVKTYQDLVGHLVLCLAPHTSAGITARIIGFSNTQGFFAHPYLHAAQRRDCDGDESCVTLLMDVFLNFSRKFLPSHRGSTQDAPLVLTSRLTPAEVDDMVFDMDVNWSYPLEFYEACLQYKNPADLKFDQIKYRLGKPSQYEGMGFTHPISDINYTNHCSAYKTLPDMTQKMEGQMDLARKIRAVITDDVARLIIEKHLIRDTKGNLRKFSMQQFRCVGCNEKFRRPPLVGKCTKCQGRLIFTISEGSVLKYLGHSLSLAKNYAVSNYLRQTVDLLERFTQEVFGKDKDKQEALMKWA